MPFQRPVTHGDSEAPVWPKVLHFGSSSWQICSTMTAGASASEKRPSAPANGACLEPAPRCGVPTARSALACRVVKKVDVDAHHL